MLATTRTSRILSGIAAGVFAVTVLILGLPSALAEEQSALAEGARLYDKWYKVIDTRAPKVAHPAYPSDKKYAKKPGANWRCKECHGWDGKGRDGAYATGKHHTGIKGINAMMGADPAAVVAVLKDATHRYGEEMNDGALGKLALFVSRGQFDYDRYIDAGTKKVKGGDAVLGEAYFNTICANCHGTKGNLPKDMGKTLAKQMGNPWEVMHKIINGQPGEQMPALRALDRQIVIDIMAHIATLPQ